MQTVILYNHPEEDTVVVTLPVDIVYFLDHTDGIIDDNVVQ